MDVLICPYQAWIPRIVPRSAVSLWDLWSTLRCCPHLLHGSLGGSEGWVFPMPGYDTRCTKRSGPDSVSRGNTHETLIQCSVDVGSTSWTCVMWYLNVFSRFLLKKIKSFGLSTEIVQVSQSCAATTEQNGATIVETKTIKVWCDSERGKAR